jgi:LPXTG-site transpeptidase (sortase) family protein
MTLRKITFFLEKCCLGFGGCLLLMFFVIKIHAYQGNLNAINEVEQLIEANVSALNTEIESTYIDDRETANNLGTINEYELYQPNKITQASINNTPSTAPVTTDSKLKTINNNEHNLTQEMDYWSSHRKERYRQEEVTSELLGILEIPQIDLKVAIFDQATEAHLNKGVARVLARSSLSGEGNLSIAGHRDSFFRHLGQLVEGDQMEVKDMTGNTFTYQVVKTWIVKPTDTYVLDKTEKSSITLITCYPFYFVGSAPERYILRAERI